MAIRLTTGTHTSRVVRPGRFAVHLDNDYDDNCWRCTDNQADTRHRPATVPGRDQLVTCPRLLINGGAGRLAALVVDRRAMSEAPVSDADRLLLAGIEVPPRAFESLRLPATGAEVAHFVALRAGACVGADYSNLASLDDSRPSLRLFHSAFLAPQIGKAAAVGSNYQ